MKSIILAFCCLFIFSACTQNQKHKLYNGVQEKKLEKGNEVTTTTIKLEKGRKLINVIWQGTGVNMWILTRGRKADESIDTLSFGYIPRFENHLEEKFIFIEQ